MIYLRHITLKALLLWSAVSILSACHKLTFTPDPVAIVADVPKDFLGLDHADGASDTKIVLHWIPVADATTYEIYHDYDLIGPDKKKTGLVPIGNTTTSQYLVTGLDAQRTYGFIVRARNAVGQERNVVVKSASTSSNHVPDFDGIAEVTQKPGLKGTYSLDVKWRAAKGQVKGYQIFRGTQFWQEDYSTPVLDVPSDGTTVNYKATVTGLTAGTQYYFVVRAYLTDPSVDMDTNTMEATNSTLGFKAPTFGGVTSAVPFGGASGFTKATVTFSTPKLDGVWNQELIEYEPGTCAEGFSSHPSQTTALDPDGTNTSAVVSDLTGNVRYRFRVRVRYTGDGMDFQDSNNACTEALMQPSPAPFKGIDTFTLYGPTADPSTMTQADLALAFNNLVVTWKPLTTGADVSFSYYQVDIATDPAFVNIVTGSSLTITDINTSRATINLLQPNTLYYARVSVYFSSGSFTIPPVGDTVVLHQITTPVVPSGEGVLPVTNDTASGIVVIDPSTLQVKYRKPTNVGAVYSGFKFYGFCAPAGNASLAPPVEIEKLAKDPTSYLSAYSVANPLPSNEAVVLADPDYTGTAGGNVFGVSGHAANVGLSPTATSVTIPSLIPNSQCCFKVMAYYKDGAGNRLGSNTTEPAYCKVPQVQAPTFSGTMTVEVPLTAAGFNSANVYVPAIDPLQASSLGYFEIGAFPSNVIPTGDWLDGSNNPIVAGSVILQSSNYSSPFVMNGLATNKQYWFAARVVNDKYPPLIARSAALSALIGGDHLVHPALPNGDYFVSHSGTVTPTTLTVSYLGPPPKGTPSAPGGGLYNGVIFYVGQGTAATAALHSAAIAYPGGAVYSGPPAVGITTLPAPDGSGDVTYSMTSKTSAVLYVPLTTGSEAVNLRLTGLTAVNWEVDAYSVYWDNAVVPKQFQESATHDYAQGKPSYNTVNFPGVNRVAVAQTPYDDGTAKIYIPFANGPATGSVSKYNVYYSPTCPGSDSISAQCNITINLSTTPIWTQIDVPVNPASTTSTYSPTGLTLPNLGSAIAGDAYFFVVAINELGTTDYSFNGMNWSYVSIPVAQSNYVRVPSALSGLSYDYMIGTNEATVSAAFPGGTPSVSTDPGNLARCYTDFASSWSGTSFNSSTVINQTRCLSSGSLDSSFPQALTVPKSGGSPVNPQSANFNQAWLACRQASSSRLMVRLPTEDEWRRAAKWAADRYSSQWSTYQSSCNTATGSVKSVGLNSACASVYGAFDMAGNMREWVDRRIKQKSVTSRFGYGPTLGQYMPNGLDISRLDGVGLPLLHDIVPPSSTGLALLMGSDFRTQDSDNFRYPSTVSGMSTIVDAETESWELPTYSDSSTGFRCVAFLAGQIPSASALALPTQPTYTGSDAIPENLFVGDTKLETMHVNDTTAPSGVKITWPTWSRKYCTDIDETSCTTQTSGFTYYVYRFLEPNAIDVRPSTPWALKDPGNQSSPYSAPTPLDPLAITSSLTMLWPKPAAGMVITDASCGSGTCSFTDSVSNSYAYPNFGYGTTGGFRTDESYLYYIVAKDPAGNYLGAQVQRYRSPYYTGDTAKSSYAHATFRREMRFRRAAVYLTDETYQNSTSKQTMAYVPMDKSGLDHDFYIYKYPASLLSGAADVTAGDETLPISLTGTTWAAAGCHDNFLRTHNLSSLCGPNGNGSANNTSMTLRSYASDTRERLDFGNAWAACRLTYFADGHGTTYFTYLDTNAEWSKASQWGDTALNGSIDDNPYLGSTTVINVETTQCNTGSVAANNAYPNCISRYGVVGMVGNDFEVTADRVLNGAGVDNGIDGLQLGVTFPGPTTVFDLLRGFFTTASVWTLPTTNANLYAQPTVSSSYQILPRGGGQRAQVGRLTSGYDSILAPYQIRCAY